MKSSTPSHLLLGKTFSFTPDEANVEDLAKACDHNKFILLVKILTLCHIQSL